MHGSRTLAFELGRLVDVWHVDPDTRGRSCVSRPGWRWHVHHWRLRSLPLISVRRRLLTRCAWCRGRHHRTDPVNHGFPGRPRGRWWRGEPHLFHRDCIGIHEAHQTCVCADPLTVHEGYGRCTFCGRFRPFGLTPERLARCRALAAIPAGTRPTEGEPGA
jgi:hypothetical protein